MQSRVLFLHNFTLIHALTTLQPTFHMTVPTLRVPQTTSAKNLCSPPVSQTNESFQMTG